MPSAAPGKRSRSSPAFPDRYSHQQDDVEIAARAAEIQLVNRLAFALILLAALSGCGEKVPRLSPVGPGDIIVAFGDSLTYGTGAPEHESYPAVLAHLVNRKVVRAGVPGEVLQFTPGDGPEIGG